MPKRGFFVLATGFNDQQWARIQVVLEKLGWKPYRLLKTAVLEFVERQEKARKRAHGFYRKTAHRAPASSLRYALSGGVEGGKQIGMVRSVRHNF